MKKNIIGGIPIVNQNKKLVGILTNRDLRIQFNLKKPVSEIVTKDNLITAREGVDLKEAENFLSKHKIEKLPIINNQGILIGLITFRDILQVKNLPFKKNVLFYFGLSLF